MKEIKTKLLLINKSSFEKALFKTCNLESGQYFKRKHLITIFDSL